MLSRDDHHARLVAEPRSVSPASEDEPVIDCLVCIRSGQALIAGVALFRMNHR